MKLKENHGPKLRTAIWCIAWVELIFDLSILIYTIYIEVSWSSKEYFVIALQPTIFFATLLTLILIYGDPKTPEEKGYEIWILFAALNCLIHPIAIGLNLANSKKYLTVCIIALAGIPSRLVMMSIVYVYRMRYLKRFVFPGVLPFKEGTVTIKPIPDDEEIPEEVKKMQSTSNLKFQTEKMLSIQPSAPSAPAQSTNPVVVGWNIPQNMNPSNSYSSIEAKGFENISTDKPMKF